MQKRIFFPKKNEYMVALPLLTPRPEKKKKSINLYGLCDDEMIPCLPCIVLIRSYPLCTFKWVDKKMNMSTLHLLCGD